MQVIFHLPFSSDVSFGLQTSLPSCLPLPLLRRLELVALEVEEEEGVAEVREDLIQYSGTLAWKFEPTLTS